MISVFIEIKIWNMESENLKLKFDLFWGYTGLV